MASTPAFASTPVIGSATTNGTIDTSLTGPTNYVTVLTGGTSGTKINEIYMQGIATTAAGVLNVFVHDGSNFSLIYQFLIAAVTSSTTALAHAQRWQPPNLVLPSNSWQLRVAQTVGTSTLRVTAYGANL